MTARRLRAAAAPAKAETSPWLVVLALVAGPGLGERSVMRSVARAPAALPADHDRPWRAFPVPAGAVRARVAGAARRMAPRPVVTAVIIFAVMVSGAAVPAAGAQPAHVLSRGGASAEEIAVTFDDGWSPASTAAIVAILEEAQATATFFPQADAVRLAPDLWRSIAAAGFPIGNHTVSHPDLTQLRPEEQLEQIDGARREIEAITGRQMITVLRPPYGAVDDGVRRASAAAGFPTLLLWDVAGGDWAETDPAVIAANALAGAAGSVVLLHAGPAATVEALPAIIGGYRARGLRLVTVPELLIGTR